METDFPGMKEEYYKLETSVSEFWKLVKFLFLTFCAHVVHFYCCHLVIVITIVRINGVCLLFLSQDTRNRLGHGGPTVLIVQPPNSQESLYKYPTVQDSLALRASLKPVTASTYVSLIPWW